MQSELEKIKQLSTAMLSLAKKEDWDNFVTTMRSRDSAIATIKNQLIQRAEESDTNEANLIAELSTLNKELVRLVEKKQIDNRQLLSELQLKEKVSSAYRNNL